MGNFKLIEELGTDWDNDDIHNDINKKFYWCNILSLDLSPEKF